MEASAAGLLRGYALGIHADSFLGGAGGDEAGGCAQPGGRDRVVVRDQRHSDCQLLREQYCGSLGRQGGAVMSFGVRARLLLCVAVVGAVAYAGWTARGWFEDARALAARQAQDALVASFREDLAGVSRQVEERLRELRANELVIDRGIIREIQKPVYQRVCAEPDVVRLLNAALRGESVSGPAEPAREMSGSAGTAAGWHRQ